MSTALSYALSRFTDELPVENLESLGNEIVNVHGAEVTSGVHDGNYCAVIVFNGFIVRRVVRQMTDSDNEYFRRSCVW
jgi:hypothetical protein